MKFSIRRFDAASVFQMKESILDIWLAVYSLPPDAASESDIRSWISSLEKRIQKEGFVFVGAQDSQEHLLGYAYGWASGPITEPFVARLAEELGELNSEWLESCFYFADLGVLPSSQGRGLGRRLVEELMACVKAQRSLLLTHNVPTVASEMYLRHGWVELKKDFKAANDKLYRIMGKKL